MPPAHYSFMQHFLAGIDEILVIGWKGTEATLQGLLESRLADKEVLANIAESSYYFMQDKIQWKGIWFLPGNPKDYCPGDLTYSPLLGSTLKLMGRFENTDIEEHDPPIIFGITEEGKKISLCRCLQTGSSFNSASYETITYGADVFFAGTSHVDIDQFRFTHIRGKVAELCKWIGVTGFHYPKREGERYAIEYELPELLSFPFTHGLEWQFRYFYDRQISGRTTIRLEESCSLMLASATPQTFNNLFEYFQAALRLMTLAFFQRPLIEALFVGIEQRKDGHSYYDEWQVFHATETTWDNYHVRGSSRYFIFTYKEIGDSFQRVAVKWAKAENIMQPTLAGLSEAFSRTDAPLEFKFLNLAHSIETFHRRTHVGVNYHDDAHKEKLARIMLAVAPEDSQWLKEQLVFSHEPKFQQRIEEILGSLPDEVNKKLLLPNIASFVTLLKHTRNYYTHYDQRLKAKAAHGETLYLLTERLKVILVATILHYLEFSDEQIRQCIIDKGNFLFNHII